MQHSRKSLTTGIAIRCTGQVLVLAVAAVFSPGCGDAGAGFVPTRPPSRPNVLLVVLDTLRADRTGFGGYERPTTPFLDTLADDGTTFRTCWSPSPWTAPAHASLFTGLRPENHGLYLGNRVFLSPESRTIAEQLGAAGYATGCFTANDFISQRFGTAQGFDAYENTSGPPHVIRESAVRTTDLALQWSTGDERGDRPFFLFLNLIDAHAPYDPPEHTTEQFLRRCTADEESKARAIDFPWTLGYSAGLDLFSRRELALASDLYDAEIAHVDRVLETFFERLDEAGLLENTLVVITSDHGENLGEHHRLEHVFALDRTLLHVPLIVHYPYLFEPGALVDDVVRLEDVPPTILDVCGVPEDDRRTIDGKSLLAPVDGRIARGLYGIPEPAVRRLRENFDVEDPDRFLVSLRSVFDGHHHLVVSSDGATTLHDVLADPRAEDDLSESEPDRVRAMVRLLDGEDDPALPR